LIYSQDGEFLKITLPAKAPYECNAYPLKLTFSGQIPKLKPAAKLLWQAKARDISDAEDCAALGLPSEAGVLILDVPANSDAASAGLKKDDVITACNGTEVKTVVDLWGLADKVDGRKLTLTVSRNKKQIQLQLTDYHYVVAEYQATPEFKQVAVAPVAAVLPAKASSGGSPTLNDPIDVLTDGKVVMGFGPIFPNGVNVGMYKLDLANVQPVAQVNTFSAGEGRARQNFVLYGSTATADPGWNVTDTTVFTPVNGVDTRQVKPTAFEATRIRRSNGKPLGNYRWLVWALSPLEDGIGGGNSSFQELQVIPVTKKK
jgi:membrane-associated protease RseP (regulator of RpoE activity)